MILSFFYAIIIGVITSIPLGAIGSYMISRYRTDGWRGGLSVAIFSAIVDSCVCGISLLGMSLIEISPLTIIIVKTVGLCILTYVCVKQFNSPVEEGVSVDSRIRFFPAKTKYFNHTKNAFVVFFLALCNPTLFAFWINLSHLIQTTILKNSTVQGYLFFSLFVGIGSALCQIVSLSFLHKMHSSSERIGKVIQFVSLSILLLTTCYFGIHIIKEWFYLLCKT